MSEGCTHDCSTCSSKCSEKDLRVPCGQFSNVKKVIGVVSGKGGVGKSLVTSLLASAMQARGHATAIMDADVTGPSIPKSFGLHGNAVGDERGLLPMESKTGIKIMSVNLLLEKRMRRSSGADLLLPELFSSSGRRLSGVMSTTCSLICLPERAMCR